jgi:hypothetical protein
MKKLITLSIVSILFTSTQLNAQITFGIKGGGSLASFKFDGDEAVSDEQAKVFNDNRKMFATFHAGVTADIALSENLVIQPALQFAPKGVKIESSDGIDNTKLRIVCNYIELPVNVLYRQSSKGGFYGGVGPYVAYAINGKTFSQLNNDAEEEDDIKFDNTDGFKRLDFGANAMIGYELPAGITVGANYSLGLTSITDPKNFGLSTKTSYIGLSVGYKFMK